MAGGFPITVNGVQARTAEALYQACRFPNHPDIQQQIIAAASPMAAKMISRANTEKTREDWETVRVAIMRWTLRAKLACNYSRFETLLQATRGRQIVEESQRDTFWGAVETGRDILIGANVLGRLLMELRGVLQASSREEWRRVAPTYVENFRFYSVPVADIIGDGEVPMCAEEDGRRTMPPDQGSLF